MTPPTPPGIRRRALLLGTASAALSACASSRDGTSTPVVDAQASGGTRPESRRATLPRGEWVIGAPLSTTGLQGELGRDVQRGVDLAVEQINLAPPGGRRIRVVYQDDRGGVEDASRVVAQPIEQERPVALIGSVVSSIAVSSASIAEAAGIPFLSPGATAPELTASNEYAFRACFADDAQGAGAAEFAVKTLGKRKLAMLYARENPYSAALAEGFRAGIGRLGATLVDETVIGLYGSTVGTLAALRSAGAELVYAPIFGVQVEGVAADARSLGVELLGGDAWATPVVARVLEGAYYTEHFVADMPWTKASEFVAAFGARYNDARPTSLSALGYDAVLILADALARATGTDGRAVRDALAATSGVKVASGIVTIDRARVTQKPVTIVQVTGGEPHFRGVVGPHADEVR